MGNQPPPPRSFPTHPPPLLPSPTILQIWSHFSMRTKSEYCQRARPSISVCIGPFFLQPGVCGDRLGLKVSNYVHNSVRVLQQKKKKASLAHLAPSDNPLLCSSPDSYRKWLMRLVPGRFLRKLSQKYGCTHPVRSPRIDWVLEFSSTESPNAVTSPARCFQLLC